jgi:hypothetical protein
MTAENKQPPGWPRGRPRGQVRVITHRVGEWSWNTQNLHKRIEQGPPDECWAWQGSTTPYGNIFGAFKNDRAQMTQANRLLWMEHTSEPIENAAIKMRCHNRFCCNIQHMEYKQIQPRQKIDLRTSAARRDNLQRGQSYEKNLD